MALNGLFCADVSLRNYSLTHSLTLHILHANAQACGFVTLYCINFVTSLYVTPNLGAILS